VATDPESRHLGGGPKGVFLLLRYVFIASASYLLLFQAPSAPPAPAQAITIALALASNVVLSLLPPARLFAWFVSGPTLVADTLWVGWALHAVGGLGEEFFLLSILVLVLAAVGERLGVVVGGAMLASLVIVCDAWQAGAWSTTVGLRVVFLLTGALFYGHVLGRIHGERRRAEQSLEWARALEGKVAERTAELTRLYEATREASSAKTDFLSCMSHELRTPLHIVIGYADMLIDGAATTPAEGAALGAHVRAAATGLLHLVDDVLEMARLEAGRVRVELRPVAVASFAEALAAREWLDPHPGVALRWEVRADGASMATDAGKLQIVLSNLITNALKYTRAGTVAVTVTARDDRAVDFVVTDTGPGMPPERLARIREPFHESTGADHRVGGVGLGLAIVHRYAALLGARLTVDSAVGRGTRVVVTVPAAPAAA
jgi:signal transduction histidine kinase